MLLYLKKDFYKKIKQFKNTIVEFQNISTKIIKLNIYSKQ